MSRRIFIITTIVFLLFVLAHVLPFAALDTIHLHIRDLFFRTRGPVPTNSQVIIVAIDDESVAHYGRWPWPRSRIAALIHALKKARARIIGIDISFLPSKLQEKPMPLEPELMPLLHWLDVDDDSETLRSHDQLLAMAINKAGNVVLPFYFEFNGNAQDVSVEIPDYMFHSVYVLFDDVNRLPSLPLLRGTSLFPPTRTLGEAARALGCVNAYLDIDGVLRNDPAILGFGGQYFPSMGIQLARLYLGLSWAQVKVNNGESIVMGERTVPIDERGFVGLNYYGGSESLPHISYRKIMEGEFEPGLLHDKVVLVGVAAAGLHDLWVTPFGPGYAGVEKHATVIANILDDRFLMRSEFNAVAEVALMLIGALGLSMIAHYRRSSILWLFCCLVAAVALAGSYWTFTVHNLWLKPLFAVLFFLSLTLALQLVIISSPETAADKGEKSRTKTGKADAAASFDLAGGEQLSSVGRYRIEGEVGQGAMGVVYKAVDPTIGRLVAIKTIRLDPTLVPEQRQSLKKRFLREAQVAGGFSHPNIVTIYDMVEKGGHFYIAMEYIEGQELSRFCTEKTLLKPRQATLIIAHICHALEYAHKQGIVHRDIKPGNIMLLKDGRPKIMDFGITKLITSDTTQTAAVLGTPSYMSPEQIELVKVDGRSDLFSVGSMFYELLCGQRPFRGPNITAILKKITTEDPPSLREVNPHINPKLAAIVTRLLAKDPHDRYQSGAEVVAILKSLLEDPSIWK